MLDVERTRDNKPGQSGTATARAVQYRKPPVESCTISAEIDLNTQPSLGPAKSSMAELMPCDAVFDPSAYFDRWLADVQAANDQPSLELPYTDADQEQEIYVESRIGSNCEVTFEGVLHFDGYSMGNVLSPNGTLVLMRRGRIEADIDVGIAIIDGSVTGNITASERVVLESDARVKGQIFTPALSMRLGAILDGDCFS